VTIIPFQAFSDSSRRSIVKRTAVREERNAFCWICCSVLQQSVALFDKLCGRPPQYPPPLWPWPLTFWPLEWCLSRMWSGLPLCQF